MSARLLGLLVCCALQWAAAGCVRAPDVAVVSQNTAFERQAAGEYPEQERTLAAAAIAPGPAPIPREQLSKNGQASGLGVVDEMVARAESDEEHLDTLLQAHCAGEALSGLTAATPDSCEQEIDPNELLRLIGRVNVHRRQVFSYIASQHRGMSDEQAAQRWRSLHVQRVVCGAQVENDAGQWETKWCAK